MNRIFKLPDTIVQVANSAAELSVQKYKHSPLPPYGTNTLRMHKIGKLGEFGLAYALNQLFPNIHIKELFNEDDNAADIIIKAPNEELKDLRIEIKSSNKVVWDKYHATVSARQVANIRKKSDIIVYCSINAKDGTLKINGFNYTDNEHEDLVNCEIMITTNRSGKDIKSFVMNERSAQELYELLVQYT